MRIGAALVVGAALAGSVPAQAAPSPEFFGANVQPMVKLRVVPPSRWDAFIAAMATDGLRIARADAAWAWAERTPPEGSAHTYEWDPPDRPTKSLDGLVGALASHGVRLSAVLSTVPNWAAAPGVMLAPSHYDDFVAFARAFAARYGTGGTFWAEHAELPYLPVRDYEVWTEANSTNFWTHRPNPAEYLRVLTPVSAAVHAADPQARVLASIGWQDFEAFVAALYARGMHGLVDGIGFHPYAPTAAAMIDLVQRLRRVMIAWGDGGLPIDLTETGQPAALTGPPASTAGNGGWVSDEARAATQSLTGEALARSDCGVRDYLIYANVGGEDPQHPGEGYEALMGIYRIADATPNATGRALGDAARRWDADPSSELRLCQGGTSPPAAQLPLELGVRDGLGCAVVHVTYRGNPLEGAMIVDPQGVQIAPDTNAFGESSICAPCAAVAASIPNVARSPDAPTPCVSSGHDGGGGGGAPGDAAPVTAPVAGPSPVTAPSHTQAVTERRRKCRTRLSGRIGRVGRRSTLIHVRMKCPVASPQRLEISIRLLRRSGGGAPRVLARRRIPADHGSVVRVSVAVRRTDRVVVRVRAHPSSGLARAQSVTLSRRGGRRVARVTSR